MQVALEICLGNPRLRGIKEGRDRLARAFAAERIS